jgi:hypothetical protein
MQRPIPWLWISLIVGLLLLPGSFGRLLLQLLSGITLALVALPLIAGGAALIGWQILKRRLRTCSSCGVTSLGSGNCPACGSPFVSEPMGVASDPFGGPPEGVDASNLTINVDAVEVDSMPLKSSDQNGSDSSI